MNSKLVLFVFPCLMTLKFNFLGEIYVSELISIFICLALFKRNFYLIKEYLSIFFVLTFIFLFSQVISDLYMNTPSKDFLRGWANILFFIINTIAILIVINNKIENIYIFSIGLFSGILLTFFINPNIYAQGGQYWKFGIGYGLTFLIALFTTKISLNKQNLKIIIFFILCSFNFYMGFRSLAGVCFIVFMLLLINKFDFVKNFFKNSKTNFYKTIILFFTILFFAYVLNYIYSFLASNNYLGDMEALRLRNQSGFFGILVGGRQELLTYVYAISKSPFIGYGSWPNNPFYDELLSDLLIKYGYLNAVVQNYSAEKLPIHSHIFGAWVTAGIFGIFIWVWLLIKILRALIIIFKNYNNWTAYFALVCVWFTWDIFFSTFKGDGRFYGAYFVYLILFINNNKNFYAK